MRVGDYWSLRNIITMNDIAKEVAAMHSLTIIDWFKIVLGREENAYEGGCHFKWVETRPWINMLLHIAAGRKNVAD